MKKKHIHKCPDCEYYWGEGLAQADICTADKEQIFNHRTGTFEEVISPSSCWMRNDGDCKKFKDKEVKP